MERTKRVEGLVPESQGQNLALTVLYVPYSLDSGSAKHVSNASVRWRNGEGIALAIAHGNLSSLLLYYSQA